MIRDQIVDNKIAESDNAALAAMAAPQEDSKPEVKLDDKPAAEIKEEEITPTPVESKPEPEKPVDDEDVEPPKNAHPDIKKGYAVLKGKLAATKEKLKAQEEARTKAETDFASLKTEYEGKVITKELESELARLRELQKTHYIEQDPLFRAEFDNKYKDVNNRALNVLKSEKLSPDLEKFIIEQGGVLAMYGSQAQMPAPYANQTQKEFIENTLLEKLSRISKVQFEKALADGMDIKYDMQREIEKAKSGGSELQKKQQQEIEKLFNDSIKESKSKYGKNAEKWPLPNDASPTEKTRIEKHNKLIDAADSRLQEFLRDGGKDPKKLAQALVEASRSQYLMENLSDKEKELEASLSREKELEAKIEKIKNSGSTGRPSAAPAPNSKPQTGKLMSDDEAITAWTQGK